jgi:hypothetical protein
LGFVICGLGFVCNLYFVVCNFIFCHLLARFYLEGTKVPKVNVSLRSIFLFSSKKVSRRRRTTTLGNINREQAVPVPYSLGPAFCPALYKQGGKHLCFPWD